MTLLQDSIKKGIADADPDARTFARKAYWGFAEHFKDQADSLMAGLDPTYKRLLQGEMSQSSSSNSLNIVGGSRVTSGAGRSRQTSVTGSSENLIDHDHHRTPSRGKHLILIDRHRAIRISDWSTHLILISNWLIGYNSATLGRKPSGSGIPKWSSPGKESLGAAGNDLMTRSTLSRQCVSFIYFNTLLLTTIKREEGASTIQGHLVDFSFLGRDIFLDFIYTKP